MGAKIQLSKYISFYIIVGVFELYVITRLFFPENLELIIDKLFKSIFNNPLYSFVISVVLSILCIVHFRRRARSVLHDQNIPRRTKIVATLLSIIVASALVLWIATALYLGMHLSSSSRLVITLAAITSSLLVILWGVIVLIFARDVASLLRDSYPPLGLRMIAAIILAIVFIGIYYLLSP